MERQLLETMMRSKRRAAISASVLDDGKVERARVDASSSRLEVAHGQEQYAGVKVAQAATGAYVLLGKELTVYGTGLQTRTFCLLRTRFSASSKCC